MTMRFIDEFRDPRQAQHLVKRIEQTVNRPMALMEVCGTHTHTIARYGIRELMPDTLRLLSGPGCPVCVTPPGDIDAAIALAQQPNVTVCTFGDMVRVPGSDMSLADLRGKGSTEEAKTRGLDNFSVLCAHKLIPPAMDALMAGDEVQIDGFICPGHVSVIIGAAAYQPLVEKYGVPCVVAGFEPLDVLQTLLALVEQLRDGRAEVQISYARAVTWEGNAAARAIMNKVFEVTDAAWRGLGTIPRSGLKLRPEFATWDALERYEVAVTDGHEHPACHCGEVLRGVMRPSECPAFGTACTPQHPLGPCMVSSEGACAAEHRYRTAATT